MRSGASAPGKVILFGEHFVVYGAPAILCAIDRRVAVTASANGTGRISISSALGSLESPPGRGISEIAPALRPLYFLADRMLAGRQGTGGIDITVESEIPPGAGLGSSSACCVAAAAAVSGLGSRIPRGRVLELAVEAEQTIFAGTSGADCAACMHGGIIRYSRDGGFSSIGQGRGFSLVIADSGTKHSTGSVVGTVGRFRGENRAEFEGMCREAAGLVEGVPGLLARGDAAGVGRLMNQNQECLRRIGVSNTTLDEMVRIGQGAAHGAKITGAGGGGCVVCLAGPGGPGPALRGFERAGYGCFEASIDCRGLDTF